MASERSDAVSDGEEGFIGRTAGYVQEPLFAISLVVFVILLLRPFMAELAEGLIYNNIHYFITLLFLISIYFVYVYFKQEIKNYLLIGIPILIGISALFCWHASRYTSSLARDYTVLSIVAGLFLLFYALMAHKLIESRTAIVLAIFLSSLITHMVTGFAPIIAEIDPYWHYKWAQVIYNTGYIPDWDPMTYPMHGGMSHYDPEIKPGLDLWPAQFMAHLFMSSTASVLQPFGLSLQDVAMLWPAIFGAFTVVLIYLLVESLFRDFEPYNKIAGFLAAFMLMFSPAFAVHAVAGNCESSAFGTFFIVSSFYLFSESFRRRSLKYAVLAGFSFLLLAVTYKGYVYAMLVLGVFGAVYPIINFIHRKNCLEHIPYLTIAVVLSQLSRIVIHARGVFSADQILIKPEEVMWLPIAGALVSSLILEFIRSYRYGKIIVAEKTLEDRIENTLERNIPIIGGIALLAAMLYLYIKGPADIINFVIDQIKGAKVGSVVGKTIAEQNPLAESFRDFLSSGYQKFGIAFLYGLGMIPLLAYLTVSKRSAGALFTLSWSIPMLWGVYNKSQYLFISSMPITVLGSTIGLFSVANRKDFDSARIIAAIMILFAPISYIPFLGYTNYSSFVGIAQMYMGPNADNYYWYPALEWMESNTSNNTAFITWWDYGHWITSIGHRYVLIDNLQADFYEIQDVARFFVNKTSEEEAFKTIDAYAQKEKEQGVDLKYVVIDWTMIGKGSALHFIATGVIENDTEGSFRNYAECMFLPQYSQTKPQVSSIGGGISSKRALVFGCTNYVRGIIFEIIDDKDLKVLVIAPDGTQIPWSVWAKSNDASILGVQSLDAVLYSTIHYDEIPQNSILNLPTYRSLIYVPAEFNDFMMTRLYLSDYIEDYKRYGLYTRDVSKLKHFKLVKDFTGGYVRVYEISYNETGGCLKKEVPEDAIVFYYTDQCPHCSNMKPLVKELESQGYNFTWLNAGDECDRNIVKEKLNDTLRLLGGVPQFGCQKTKELQLGEFADLSEMRDFADKCRK